MGGGNYSDLCVGLEINGRGNTGWFGSPKKSYNIKLESKESLVGMEKSKKWALIDNYHDRSLLRNSFISLINHKVFNNLGWNPTYVHCDFFLNGEYKGNYIIAERIKIESGRLNIKDISKIDDISKGGFLCEIDERFDEQFHFRTTNGINTYTGQKGVAICLKDPDEVSEEVFNYVKTIVQTAEDALFSDYFKDPETGYAHYFDLDALVDWYLIHEFACMFDASDFYTSAFFFYDPSDKKLHMGPCWDYDTAMRRDVDSLEVRKVNSWYKRLFEDESFDRRVRIRWNEKKQALKESVKELDALYSSIRVSADFNFMKWPVLGTHYDGIDAFESLKTYQAQVDFFKEWAIRRIDCMDTYFPN